MLDTEEYFQLAVHASQQGNHHASLEHLHKILETSPEHLPARYLLAAEHAELGLYERACKELEEILRVAPEMATARFQLGLLALQLGRIEEARQAFSILSGDEADESLKAFSEAYLSLLDERSEDAVTQFSAGLELCNNPALKGDMSRVLSALTEGSVGQESGETQPGAGSTVFLGAYGNSLEVP